MAKPLVLVTGGTGYIGSHTVVELQLAGYDVIIVDDLSNSNEGVLDGITAISGIRPSFYSFNLCDLERVKELAANYPNLNTIVHFAAFKAVGESVQEPLKYYQNNIGSLLNLLHAFGDRTLNFVFSSSCTVYGQPDTLPVSEKAPIKEAQSPYGNTKQIGEEILSDQSKAAKLNVIALRYFNPIGAHQSAAIGELPLGVPNNLVPFITQTAIGKRKQLTVYGNDYNTADGSCIRDYIHVVDLAKAHVIACQRMELAKQKQKFEVFNIGTGNGYSVLEVIEAFERTSGTKLPYTIGPRRSGDVEQVYGDTTLANTELGWKAELGLDQMVSSAWIWEQKLAQQQHSSKS